VPVLTVRHQLFRGTFISRYEKPLSSDALSAFALYAHDIIKLNLPHSTPTDGDQRSVDVKAATVYL
jgi:hypothetical protein